MPAAPKGSREIGTRQRRRGCTLQLLNVCTRPTCLQNYIGVCMSSDGSVISLASTAATFDTIPGPLPIQLSVDGGQVIISPALGHHSC